MGLPRKKVLISLHGIRTRGEWQKELCPLVSEKSWKYYPLDYGYFSAAQLATGLCHNKKILCGGVVKALVFKSKVSHCCGFDVQLGHRRK